MVVWFILGGYLLLVHTSAHSTANWATGPVGTVVPMPGAPLSVQQVEERKQFSSDGVVTNKIVTSQIYRDSAGRVRIEWCYEESSDCMPEIVYLLDPVAYSLTILLPRQKSAFRDTVPRTNPAGFQVALPAAGQPLPMRKWATQTQAIGVRLIQGLEIQGTRTIQRSDEQPSLIATWETWTSQALGLTLEVNANGPTWEHTVKLRNLNLREPDHTLFAVPPGYTTESQGADAR
jgi:hypothetical protein